MNCGKGGTPEIDATERSTRTGQKQGVNLADEEKKKDAKLGTPQKSALPRKESCGSRGTGNKKKTTKSRPAQD